MSSAVCIQLCLFLWVPCTVLLADVLTLQVPLVLVMLSSFESRKLILQGTCYCGEDCGFARTLSELYPHAAANVMRVLTPSLFDDV